MLLTRRKGVARGARGGFGMLDMLMKPKPVLALVGCGRWGVHILRDLVSLGCEVHVAADSEASRERAIAGGAASFRARVEDLPAVGGAVVAVPTVWHAAIIRRLMPRPIPIFVEKPMTLDAREAKQLAAELSNRLFVMDKWRYHPGVEALRDIARSGELGAVIGLSTWRLDWGNPHADVDAVWILAPHDLSIALEILGHIPQPRAAVAEAGANGLRSLSAILGSDPWLRMEVSEVYPKKRREVRLHLREGTAVLGDGYDEHLDITRRGPDGAALVEKRCVGAGMPLFRELEAFVRHLVGGPPPKSSAAEGAEVVDVIARLRAMAGAAAKPSQP
jgi:predicted dehydrogenase